MPLPSNLKSGTTLEWTDAAGAIETLSFFVVKENWPDQGADVSKHPVEQGAKISDHVSVRAPRCELTILATQTPLVSNPWAQAAVQALSLTPASGAPVIASTLQFGGGDVDFVEELIAQILVLKDAVTLFTVKGSKQVEPNMVIADLSYIRDEDTGLGAIITLGLEQLRIVQTQTVAVALPSIPRAAMPVHKGAQDPVDGSPAQQQTLLHAAEQPMKRYWLNRFKIQ